MVEDFPLFCIHEFNNFGPALWVSLSLVPPVFIYSDHIMSDYGGDDHEPEA